MGKYKAGDCVRLRNGVVLGPLTSTWAADPPRDILRFVLENAWEDVVAFSWDEDGTAQDGSCEYDIVKRVLPVDDSHVRNPPAPQESAYAVIVTGKAGGLNYNKPGQKFVVVKDLYGPSSTPLNVELTPHTVLPFDTLTFPDLESVEKFTKEWKGHPWWCNPEKFEAVKVVRKMRSVLDGYMLAPDYVWHCYAGS